MRRRSFVAAILSALALPIPDTTRWRYSSQPGVMRLIQVMRDRAAYTDDAGNYYVVCHPTVAREVTDVINTIAPGELGSVEGFEFVGFDPAKVGGEFSVMTETRARELVRSWGAEPLSASQQFDIIDDNAPWFREHRGMRYWMRRGYGRTFA